jgi:hypothetical protein
MFTRAALLGAAVLTLAACASRPSDTQAYVHAVQANPDYKQGYDDGCEYAGLSTEHAEAHRDNGKFQNIPEYRLGWVDGQDKCKPVTHVQPSAPSIRTYN